MKKIISILLSLILTFGSLSVISCAVDTETIVIDYNQKVEINCMAFNMNDGNRLAVYSDDELVASINNSTFTYTSERLKTTTIFTVKVIDENGNVVKSDNGSEKKESVKVNVNNSFFAKLKAFFYRVFGKEIIVGFDVFMPIDIDPTSLETVEEVLALYNAVRKVTAEKGAPKGHQTMMLDGEITGDGALGAVLKVLSPAAKSALERNSRDTDWIPGADCDDIRVEDVKSAKATVNEDGSVTVEIQLKEQTDGPDGGRGPVERGISTLGSIELALNELGAEITSGRETITLTYTDAYVTATIKNGVITGGTWHYTVKVHIGDAKGKLGITANLQNINATIDYSHVI